MTFPALKTARLRLTELQPEDETDIFGLFSNPDVVEYYDLAAFTQVEQARSLIGLFQSRYKQQLGIRWAIRLQGAEQCIGTCGFNSWSNTMRNAVIGYDLLPEFWGKGYASEAVHAICLAAFAGQLPCGPLHRIQADTVPGNTASETLLLKLGFKDEGLRRECGYWKNRFHDLRCFGLLSSEFVGAE